MSDSTPATTTAISPGILPLPALGCEFQLLWGFSSASADGLEADYRASRQEFEEGLEAVDHLEAFAPAVQDDLFSPEEEHGRGADIHGRGGAHTARNPEVAHLERLAAVVRPRGRWNGHDVRGHEDVAALDLRELCPNVLRCHWHRGRRRALPDGELLLGPSARDFAFQREWTRARSASIGWFTRAKSAHYRLPTIPATLAELVGRGQADRVILGMVLDAMAGGWVGVTASAPELHAFTGFAVSTIWAAIRRLEARGWIVRLRRYKPGKEDRTVEFAANWYGAGPALLDARDRWEQGDLADVQRARRERAKRRARHRRRRRRGAGRRRLRATGQTLAFVDRATWVVGQIAAAQRIAALEAEVFARQLAEDQRVGDLCASMTWAPPPAELDAYRPDRLVEIGSARIERARRVASAAEELGLEALVDQAERAAAELRAWRATTGRDDEGQRVDDVEALVDLEAWAERVEAELEAQRFLVAFVALWGGLDEEPAGDVDVDLDEEPAGDVDVDLDEEPAGDVDVEEDLDATLDAAGLARGPRSEPIRGGARRRAELPDRPAVGDLARIARQRQRRDTIRVQDGPPGGPENTKEGAAARPPDRRPPDDPGARLADELRRGSARSEALRAVSAKITAVISERAARRKTRH